MSQSSNRFIDWGKKAYQSWATRSLAIGAVATLVDLGVLLLCVRILHFRNPVAAMCGVVTGAVLTFIANRHFAFRDNTPDIAPQALKFVLATGVAMLVHASFVWFFADHLHVPVVVAKLLADIIVFSVGQLLVLRYLVFPQKKAKPEAAQ